MHSNSNKKRYGSDYIEVSLTPSSQLLTNIQSKQSFASSTQFDSKLSPTSPECTGTKDKDKKTILLTPKTKLIYDHFISVRKADTKSLDYLEANAKNLSLTISLTEWVTLSKCLLLFESDEKYKYRLLSSNYCCFANTISDFHDTATIQRQLLLQSCQIRAHCMNMLLRHVYTWLVQLGLVHQNSTSLKSLSLPQQPFKNSGEHILPPARSPTWLSSQKTAKNAGYHV